MKDFIKPLKKFGLTENEAKVYIECLRQDELSPFQISKLTKIPRTTVYDILMSLSLKQLVELEQSDGFQKQQTKVKAKNPSILRKILQKRRDDSYKVEVEISEILPELKGIFHKEDANANFKFYPGIEGAKKVYLTMENTDLNVDMYSWSQLMPHDVFGSEYVNKDVLTATAARKKTGTIAKELVPLNAWTKHVITYQYQLDPNYIANREFRYIDGTIFECYLDFVIKGESIRVTCAEGEEVWGLYMRSTALTSTFKSIFMLTWQMATPITKEIIESWGKNKYLEAEKFFKK